MRSAAAVLLALTAIQPSAMDEPPPMDASPGSRGGAPEPALSGRKAGGGGYGMPRSHSPGTKARRAWKRRRQSGRGGGR